MFTAKCFGPPPLILAIRRLRQEHLEFEINLHYKQEPLFLGRWGRGKRKRRRKRKRKRKVKPPYNQIPDSKYLTNSLAFSDAT